MICDAWTVMRKDLREMASLPGQGLSGTVTTLFILAVFGVVIPWQFGAGWTAHPIFLLLWIWLPWLLVAGVVSDTFAGERERHTLDTLYATRLSNDAILLGKVGAAAVYGWALTLITLALSAATLAIIGAHHGISPTSLLSLAGLSLLTAALAATLGALGSLHAAGARQAQQTMLAAVPALVILLLLGGQILAQCLPGFWRRMMQVLAFDTAGGAALAATALGLLAIELVLFALAAKSVRRSRLGSR